MAAVFRAIFAYLFLVFIVRTVGRRPGKQMTPFEYVLIFFIGGLALTAVIGDDRSITNAFCAVMAVALTHFAIAKLRQISPMFGLIADGTPSILLEHGAWHPETMRKMRIQDDDVMAAARDKGIRTLEQIEYAILERNGEISIIGKSKQS
jgi:uncharacterized membrane protein YcaP (DUF421 family)